MTNAERFEKALQAIFSMPPERVEQINRQAKDDYSAFGRQELREDRAKKREVRRNREADDRP